MDDEMFVRKLHALFSYRKHMREEMFREFLDAYVHQFASEAKDDDEYQRRAAHARHVAQAEAKARFS